MLRAFRRLSRGWTSLLVRRLDLYSNVVKLEDRFCRLCYQKFEMKDRRKVRWKEVGE